MEPVRQQWVSMEIHSRTKTPLEFLAWYYRALAGESGAWQITDFGEVVRLIYLILMAGRSGQILKILLKTIKLCV